MEKIDRKNNKINYTLFSIIIIFTIFSSIFLYLLYERYKENKSIYSAISDISVEITIGNINEYINENDSFFLYLNESSDKIRDYEEEMFNLAKERDILIVFINMSKINNNKSFLSSFNKKYGTKYTIDKIPSLVFIKNKKIVGHVEENKEKLKINEVINLFSLKDKEFYD